MMAATPYDQVMEDMLMARDFATQLQGMVRDSPKAGLIVDEILRTFSRAIEAAKAMAAEEGSEVQSEVSCASGKRKEAAGRERDRRGTSRGRTHQSSVNTVVTKDLEDGHAWRKYGQKDIQNSKHPKAYFRCTHKYDQQCAAQRQVQRCDEAPDTFRVTYIGVHTCRDPATVAPIVVSQDAADASALAAGSRLISFAPKASTPSTSTTTTTGIANYQEGALLPGPSSGLPSLKMDGVIDQEEVLSSVTPVGSARNPVATPGPDQGDVTSVFHLLGGVDDMCFTMHDETFNLDDILLF